VISTLLAGLSSLLKNNAAAPFVSNMNVKLAVLGTRMKPTSQTVSADELLETYRASSVQLAEPVGDGGVELDNVD
jgi:outer membrane murein-binding lipoprotein Lpp